MDFENSLYVDAPSQDYEKNKQEFVDAIGSANYDRLVGDLHGSCQEIVRDCYDTQTANPAYALQYDQKPIAALRAGDGTSDCCAYVMTDKKTGETVRMQFAWKFVKAAPLAAANQ